MSLVRTALRLAAVAALEADPVVSALCPGRIYDSRIDELDAQDPVPVIIVFTEDDKGGAWSVNNGGPPFDHACELLIEISMRVIVPATETDPVSIGLAETDPQAEATIDLLEEVAIAAVTNADTPQAALIRKAVLRRATEFKSVRFASADSGSKLALRAVALTCHLKIDQPDPRVVPTGPFAALPAPLRTVAASLAPTSAGYATCTALAQRLTVPIATPFEGIDLTIVPANLKAGAPLPLGDHNAPDPLAMSIDLACPTPPSAST